MPGHSINSWRPNNERGQGESIANLFFGALYPIGSALVIDAGAPILGGILSLTGVLLVSYYVRWR